MSRTFNLISGIFMCLLLTVSYGTHAQAQAGTTAPEITEVYGKYVSDLNAEQIAWLYNKLERSEVKKMDRKAEEQIPLLSSVALLDKYVGDLKKDSFSEPLKINPLKYQINFMNKKDQVFRIDGTDYVLFVKGKSSVKKP